MSGAFHAPIQFVLLCFLQVQYADAETRLHYNRFSYYNPNTARYLTQDPIGLADDENLYTYTPNPTRWIDPLGLSPSRQVVTAGGKYTGAIKR